MATPPVAVAPAAPVAAEKKWWERDWESFRCRNCQRLLFKISGGLRPGAALEIKCGCKAMNYLMGTETPRDQHS